MLNKKPHFESHKALAESKLADRLKILKSNGLTDLQIQRDPKIRHYRAAIRQARFQLADIARLESEIIQKAEIKAGKLAAPKLDQPKHKRSVSDQAKKRAKKEKKLAATAASESAE